jgi:hypothetical protein
MRQKRRVRKVGKFATACRQDIGCFSVGVGVASWLLLSVEQASVFFGTNYAAQPTLPASNESSRAVIIAFQDRQNLFNIAQYPRESSTEALAIIHTQAS